MSVEENKTVVVRWNEEIVSGGSVDKFDELLADKYCNRSIGIDRQGMKERFEKYLAEHPTWKAKVDDVIGEADKVAIRMSFYENEKKTTEGLAFYRLVDGKIVDDWYCTRKIDEV